MKIRQRQRSIPGATALFVLSMVLVACNKSSPDAGTDETESGTRADFVQVDGDTTAAERDYLEFGRSVFLNLCAHDYAAFHGQLSSHAVSRMSLNQFDPADDDAEFDRNEAKPRTNVALTEFQQLMARMESRRGRPAKPLDLHVHSTDPVILAGETREKLDAIDVMFAIGNMPKLVPPAQRKASLRGQIQVELTPAQLAEEAKAMEMTAEELAGDPDFAPYLNLKLVIIEENGQLRVGYFEFLPPSMFD